MPPSVGDRVILLNGTVKSDRVAMRDLKFWLLYTKAHNATTRLTTYALGDNHYNPHYSLGHDNWLTSWISRPRARNPLGQPVIALGHKWIIVVIPSGIGG